VGGLEIGRSIVDSEPFRKAAIEAAQLLTLTSMKGGPRFAAPGEDVLHPDRTIRQALAHAQFVLNSVCTLAIESRVRALEQIQGKQRFINLLHLLTGSGFALLLTNHFEEPMKWIGAIVSFGAAAFALWLPRNVAEIERTVFEDSRKISALSGEIARIETELILNKGVIDDLLAERIAAVIASCREQAVKSKLGQITLGAGVYPPAPTGDSTGNAAAVPE
jgi:hypothetical protein